MTVHIASSSSHGALLLSDSQMSGFDSEDHGFQKQFVGENFLVGGSGHAGIISRTFQFLDKQDISDANEAADQIENFIRTEIRETEWNSVAFILLGPASGSSPTIKDQIRLFDPGTYVHFDEATNFASIGSGSTFVHRCVRYQDSIGIEFASTSLVDLLIESIFYAEAANESLTVDDKLLVSFVNNNKTYVMGDQSLNIRYAPKTVRRQWHVVASLWEEIRQQVDLINAESRESIRVFSSIRSGIITKADLNQFEMASKTVAAHRKATTTKLNDFFSQYDRVVGR